jgi:hypothetical protein
MFKVSKKVSVFSLGIFVYLIFCLAVKGSQPTQPSQPTVPNKATLGWTASTDQTVTGYYVYCGTTSGVYTNKIDVGTNTSYTVSGLVPGRTYYFSGTSYNASKVESTHVAEVSFVDPGMMTVSQNRTNNMTALRFSVAPFHIYQIQGSTDLRNWTNVWTSPSQTTNGWIEYDEPRNSSVPGNFFRLIVH